jgi:hypothetical protein
MTGAHLPGPEATTDLLATTLQTLGADTAQPLIVMGDYNHARHAAALQDAMLDHLGLIPLLDADSAVITRPSPQGAAGAGSLIDNVYHTPGLAGSLIDTPWPRCLPFIDHVVLLGQAYLDYCGPPAHMDTDHYLVLATVPAPFPLRPQPSAPQPPRRPRPPAPPRISYRNLMAWQRDLESPNPARQEAAKARMDALGLRLKAITAPTLDDLMSAIHPILAEELGTYTPRLGTRHHYMGRPRVKAALSKKRQARSRHLAAPRRPHPLPQPPIGCSRCSRPRPHSGYPPRLGEGAQGCPRARA